MRSAEEMDQADVELRETIVKIWPYSVKNKIELLVPTTKGRPSTSNKCSLQSTTGWRMTFLGQTAAFAGLACLASRTSLEMLPSCEKA